MLFEQTDISLNVNIVQNDTVGIVLRCALDVWIYSAVALDHPAMQFTCNDRLLS